MPALGGSGAPLAPCSADEPCLRLVPPTAALGLADARTMPTVRGPGRRWRPALPTNRVFASLRLRLRSDSLTLEQCRRFEGPGAAGALLCRRTVSSPRSAYGCARTR